MTLKKRIAWVRVAQTEHKIDLARQAGEEGELLVKLLMDKVLDGLGKVVKVWHALRVPNSNGRGKFEIDVVALLPDRLLIIEVKHWGGEIKQTARGWSQHPRSGDVRQFDDPLALMATKKQALQTYLAMNGCDSNNLPVEVALVFSTGTLLPLSSSTAAFSFEQFVDFVCAIVAPYRRGIWQKAWDKLTKKAPPRLSAPSKVVLSLDRLPTWDALTLNGGGSVKGDIDGSFRTRGGGSIDRLETAALIFWTPRQTWLALLRIVIVWHRPRNRFGWRWTLLDPDQEIGIRFAGQPQMSRIPVSTIRAVSYGWRDQSYFRPDPAG